MEVLVLGSGAGGGVPQWNCHCHNCKAVREGSPHVTERTQSSLAVSPNGKDWVLINASPDLRQQINQSPQLWPNCGKSRDNSRDGSTISRGTNIKGVILTDSQIDHTLGLMIMREGLPLDVYCTDIVFEDLSQSLPIFPVMKHWHGGYQRKTINIDAAGNNHLPAPFKVEKVPELTFYPVPLYSNAPPYSPYRDKPVPGNNIGLKIVDDNTGHSVFYAPGIVETNDDVEASLAEVDCAILDATLWTDDEMINHGFSEKTGKDMGHISVGGDTGVVSLLEKFNLKHKILIHINNTNPILDETSKEHLFLKERDIVVAKDGMVFNI
ncbi:pyrroloquinoline quinone biosynthesis protein PqqB [Paraneptunicella aestuarii]|uniref:pyrroloquinoline quinone biosynthesis protein PqqB n=1 Tax=Paraneptunicella aestuarii TaxID=2831148 RepID=UPI001E4A0CB6|nr:pyrroloquinoline quinone biosynthesis protein PqqB [Paraneptunicella aestuarii]UAA39158.1 pyrroloquinoline quinone biosynthesis protein PqqB [Paraneptunicella aestuarii]